MNGTKKLVLTFGVSLTVALTACSSSTKPTEGSTASLAISTSASAATSSTASPGLALAQARLIAARKPQQELPIKTPLTNAPAPGQTIVVMQCDDPGCTQNTNGVKAASAIAGLNVQVIPFQQTNPATLVAGMNTALQYHPIATLVIGLPEATWASVIPNYKAAGVPIIGEGTTADLTETVIAALPTPTANANIGRRLADWIIVDSGGAGKVLFEDVPEIAAVTADKGGIEAELKELCPACTLSTATVTLAQLGSGTANQAIVSALRANQSIQYVVSANGPWVDGLRSSLNTSDLNKVKILGITPDAASFAGIKDGSQSAWMSFSIRFTAFVAVDAALRANQKMPIPTYDGVIATQLIDTTNIASLTADQENLGVPPTYDYPGQFKVLWRRG